MFVDKSLIHPPAYYSLFWTLLGSLILLIILLIIFLIFFSTRKKKIKTIATLKQKAPVVIDLKNLQNKYLEMVDVVVSRYVSRKIKSSTAHQDLSMIVRLFYAEASGFHAEVLTLNDLKHSKAQKLAALIETYYPDEFNMLEEGSVNSSAEKAKQLIANIDIQGTKKL